MFRLFGCSETATLRKENKELKEEIEKNFTKLDEKIKQVANYIIHQILSVFGGIIACTTILTGGSIIATLKVAAEGTTYYAAMSKGMYIWMCVFPAMSTVIFLYFFIKHDIGSRKEAPWMHGNQNI